MSLQKSASILWSDNEQVLIAAKQLDMFRVVAAISSHAPAAVAIQIDALNQKN